MVGGLTFDASRNINCTRQRNILPPRHSQRGRLSLWSVRPGFLYTGRQAGLKPVTEYEARFPNDEIATISINLFRSIN